MFSLQAIEGSALPQESSTTRPRLLQIAEVLPALQSLCLF